MRTLDIKYYALMYAIAESGSAITLFERSGHKVYLTPAAQRLLATAVEVIPKMVDAEQDAVAHSVEPSLRWGIDAHDVLCILLCQFNAPVLSEKISV